MTPQNPYKKYEDAFEGFPSVWAVQVRDEPGMRVAGRHMTPDREKAQDMLTVLTALFWAAVIAFVFRHRITAAEDQAEMWTLLACVLWATLIFCSRSLMLPHLMKSTVVSLSPRHIQIGAKVYDASLQHKFSMELHRKAADEADAELRAQQRGKSHVRHFKYYRKAFHIHFEYLGQKILVTDISNPESAEKFLRALNAVDKIVHNEKSLFAGNSNADESANGQTATAQTDYFGKRPALD